jgi:hypothetical protein
MSYFPLSILAQARAAILTHLMSGTRHKGSRWVRMPRYFFNVYHERPEPDDLGDVLPDRQAAWKEATITAGPNPAELGRTIATRL